MRCELLQSLSCSTAGLACSQDVQPQSGKESAGSILLRSGRRVEQIARLMREHFRPVSKRQSDVWLLAALLSMRGRSLAVVCRRLALCDLLARYQASEKNSLWRPGLLLQAADQETQAHAPQLKGLTWSSDNTVAEHFQQMFKMRNSWSRSAVYSQAVRRPLDVGVSR